MTIKRHVFILNAYRNIHLIIVAFRKTIISISRIADLFNNDCATINIARSAGPTVIVTGSLPPQLTDPGFTICSVV